MNTMAGAFSFACSNRSRTRLAPTPTNISTKSEPEIEKNGTPASPATARASSVLPVPGGPYSRTPFGIFAPTAWNLAGSDRNSLISCNSSIASSHPATSVNVVCGVSFVATFAFDLPKPRMRLPPPWTLFIISRNSAPMMRNGRMPTRIIDKPRSGTSTRHESSVFAVTRSFSRSTMSPLCAVTQLARMRVRAASFSSTRISWSPSTSTTSASGCDESSTATTCDVGTCR